MIKVFLELREDTDMIELHMDGNLQCIFHQDALLGEDRDLYDRIVHDGERVECELNVSPVVNR